MKCHAQTIDIVCWLISFGQKELKRKTHKKYEWKDVTPSQTLIKWFGNQPEKWEPFYKRYSAELHASSAFAQLKNLINNHQTLTLLYSATDQQHIKQ
jgi:uncharacterized protein YeaO (DUF488 family)